MGIVGGSLFLTSSSTLTAPVVFLTNSQLDGTGTLVAAVVFDGAAKLPLVASTTFNQTSSPQWIISGTLRMNRGATLSYSNNGTGANYPWVRVSGAVVIAGASMLISGSYLPWIGESWKCMVSSTSSVPAVTSIWQQLSGTVATLRYNASVNTGSRTMTITRMMDAEIGAWILVNPTTGSDVAPCGDNIRPCASIRMALTLASIGMGVELADGTVFVNEGLVGTDKGLETRMDAPLSIRAALSSTPIVDCGGLDGFFVRPHPYHTATFNEITFKRCRTAVQVDEARAMFIACTFEAMNNSSSSSTWTPSGSAITLMNHANVQISGSRFVNNNSSVGSSAIVAVNQSSLMVENSIFQKNRAMTTSSLINIEDVYDSLATGGGYSYGSDTSDLMLGTSCIHVRH
jgi:hypothetical protein